MPSPAEMLSRLPRPLRLALYAGAVLVLLYLTLVPTRDVPGVGLVWDKAEHAGSWAVLTLLGMLLSTKRRWAILVFAFGFGVVVEVLQATLPLGRDGEVQDLMADCVGIATAWFLWRVARHLGWVR